MLAALTGLFGTVAADALAAVGPPATPAATVLAVVGRPLTPVSYAGGAGRTVRSAAY
jgi:hypothetical protein